MALPRIKSPLFETKLPSSGKIVTYRGFLMAEEKILLQAMQSEDTQQINMSLKQIINNCTEGTVDPDLLPIFDVEFLFLNIIAKSVGEELNLDVLCENCQHEIQYKINIFDIAVPVVTKGADIVKLTDTIGIKMVYPTIDTCDYADVAIDVDGIQTREAIYDAVALHAEYIYDEDGVYYLKDQSKEEIADFFDSLSGAQWNKIKDFFIKLPAISESIEFTCPECGHENKYVARGIHELFV